MDARRTIGASLQHSVFQEFHDDFFPRLKYEFVLVRVPLTLSVHLEDCLDIIVDSLNVQGDVVFGFFGPISAFWLEKLQLVDFLRRD